MNCHQASKGFAEPLDPQEMHTSPPLFPHFDVIADTDFQHLDTDHGGGGLHCGQQPESHPKADLIIGAIQMVPIPLAVRKRWQRTGSSPRMFHTLCRDRHQSDTWSRPPQLRRSDIQQHTLHKGYIHR
jgi:hypothetical protein